MRRIPENVVAAVGRMTIAAAELEYLLAWIGADQAGGDAAAVFGQPGESLRAARGSVQFAPPAYREGFIGLVEAAGTQLAQSHTALRAMWHENGRIDATVFDDIAGRLLRCRDALQSLVEEAELAASR